MEMYRPRFSDKWPAKDQREHKLKELPATFPVTAEACWDPVNAAKNITYNPLLVSLREFNAIAGKRWLREDLFEDGQLKPDRKFSLGLFGKESEPLEPK